MILPILTFSEVCFIKAELAQRGYIDNAQHYYEEGVKAAMELWGVNIPETYLITLIPLTTEVWSV